MTETFQGGCHCGAVRYEVDLDLMTTGTIRCNCTWCSKQGWWSTHVKPAAFRLLRGEAPHLEEGQWSAKHRCPTCHILVYAAGDQPEVGGAFVSLNVRTLEGAPLEGVPVAHLDGLHDTWAPLGVTRWRDPLAQPQSAAPDPA